MPSRTRGVIFAVLAGFASATVLPAAADEAMGRLSGTDSGNMRVLMRSIDNGDILWSGGYQLSTETKISAGAHVVSVMCEFNQPGIKELVPGELTITVEPKKDYAVSGIRSPDGKTCIVSAKPD